MRLNIASIVYGESKLTCEYCETYYTKYPSLLTTPEEIKITIFNDPYEEDDDGDMLVGYMFATLNNKKIEAQIN